MHFLLIINKAIMHFLFLIIISYDLLITLLYNVFSMKTKQILGSGSSRVLNLQGSEFLQGTQVLLRT